MRDSQEAYEERLEKVVALLRGEVGSLKKTLRDDFAGQALQGMLASSGSTIPNQDYFVPRAYKMADAMLQERER